MRKLIICSVMYIVITMNCNVLFAEEYEKINVVASTSDVVADEPKWIAGSVGGEVWYAWWNAENQWSKQGVNIDYKIDPSIIYGTSASINYVKKKSMITGIVLDYLTSEMEAKVHGENVSANSGSNNTFQQIKAKIDQKTRRKWLSSCTTYACQV